jgi:hypothetical protein
MDYSGNHQAENVHKKMPLATTGLLGPVKATLASLK